MSEKCILNKQIKNINYFLILKDKNKKLCYNNCKYVY